MFLGDDPIILQRLNPVAFSFGPIQIRWYALAYIVGIALGWFLARYLLTCPKLWGGKAKINKEELDYLISWVTIGILLGGRIGHVLFYDLQHFTRNPIEIVQVWRGGMSFHGGFYGAMIAIIICSISKPKELLLSSFDLASVVTPIGIFLGRIANFVNGELWGRVTTSPLGVIFPWVDFQLRHPSQIYEAVFEGLLLFGIMLTVVCRWKILQYPGIAAGIFSICYGVIRICVEITREVDQTGFIYGCLTMGQILSISMLLLGLLTITYASRRAYLQTTC